MLLQPHYSRSNTSGTVTHPPRSAAQCRRVGQFRCYAPETIYGNAVRNEILDACSVCFWRPEVSSFCSIVVNYTVFARRKLSTKFGRTLPDVTSLPYTSTIPAAHNSHAHRKRTNLRTSKPDQFYRLLTMLDYRSCASSAHAPRIT